MVNQFGIDSVTQGLHITGCSVAIENPLEQVALEVSPNPTSDRLRLQLTGRLKPVYQVELMDMFGKRVMSRRLTPQGNVVEAELELQGLPVGIYFLSVGDGEMRQVVKVVRR